MPDLHQVVVIGGGFGGLYATQMLRKASVDITLIDRRNYHLFQPLLYQVATGGLSPANIAAPLREILKSQGNCRVVLASVTSIDLTEKRVMLEENSIRYDSLIVAAGSKHHYFGRDDWEPLAPGLKSIEDATEIRRRFLLAFEEAEKETDPQRRRQWLTFVVVGAGPTGVELAGAMREMARDTLRRNFRNFDPADAKILIVEGTDRVLPPYPPDLSANAEKSLHDLGVEFIRNAIVTDIQPEAVTVRRGEQMEQIETRTVFWGAGIQASPLTKILANATGATLDRSGRILVNPDLTLPDHPEVFVIGDMCSFPHQTGTPLPAVAQVAMQQGKYAAKLIQARLAGKTLPPFRYKNLGSMATIGRNAAVADIGNFHLAGRLAWFVWLFIHLMYIVQFQSRLLILLQWAWNYVTRNRSARLITGEDLARHERAPRTD